MTIRPRAVVVAVSLSFTDSVRSMVEDAGFDVLDHSAASDDTVPPAAIGLVLAGGSESDGIDWLRLHPAGVPWYLVGAAADHRLGLGAVARGATDYFALPADLDLLRRTLERLAREAEAAVRSEAFATLERSSSGFDAIEGSSPALLAVIAQARRVAAVADVTVLIGGETGTGKDLLARAIHLDSPRARAPFIEINCAAIPSNLLESELFGHEKGAFTGAIAAKPGLLALADGGTLFLDEVGSLPLDLQPKLLRALESKEIRRVGGQVTHKVDVRVIGASHVDLAEAVATGHFREDLYYRLNVVRLVLPPLRDRGADIELLAEWFAGKLATQYGMPVPTLSADVRQALRCHPWPGNVRELRNAIERALVLSPPGTLAIDDLLTARPTPEPTGSLPFPAPLTTIIRAAVLETIARADGNKSEAARRLGISRPRLQRILDGDTEG